MSYKLEVQRKKDFSYPHLSKKDEGVPKTHVPLYQIFVASPEIRQLYGENVANELRRKTFANVLKVFNEQGARYFDKFWNAYIDEITELKVNEFANYEKLKPFCKYVECFTTPYITQTKRKKQLVSFGISKEILDKYQDKLLESKKLGIEFVPPTLTKNDTSAYQKRLATTGNVEVMLKKNHRQPIPRNEVYNRFHHWTQLQGVTKVEGVLMALEAVVKLHPIDGILENLSDYRIPPPFQVEIKKERLEQKKLTCMIAGDLFQRTLDIIARYNLDIENIKNQITLTTYTNNALHLLNSKMDLKYTNPVAYEEQLKTKEYVEYAEKLLEKGIDLDE